MTTDIDSMISGYVKKVEVARKATLAARETAADLAALLRMGLIPDERVEEVRSMLPVKRGPKPKKAS